MKKSANRNKKPIGKSKDSVRSIRPGKRISTREEVIHASFGEHSKRSVTDTAPTHEQISKRAYLIWQQKGRLADQEEACWLQAEADLRREY
jgi:hypothetical protein